MTKEFFKIAIIGQGYVGLPLSLAASKSGYTVAGIDSDEEKVGLIKMGSSPVEDVSNDDLNYYITTGKLNITCNFDEVITSKVVILCVPTPLKKNKSPDLSILLSALTSIASHIQVGTLIIVESTVGPGTTRNMVRDLILSKSGLGENDFYLAYSPERVNPRSEIWHIGNTPKIVAGLNKKSELMAVEFYSKFVQQIVVCDTLEIAESAKLLENTFRLVNISMINEFRMFCDQIGIDIKKVISAAATKPYGFMPFTPSLGAGGHCIPVDPIYLADKCDEVGVRHDFIDLALKINEEVHISVLNEIMKRLGEIENKKILVIGLAYKPNLSDIRESPSVALISSLKQQKAKVYWHDNLVKKWNGEISTDISHNFDIAILAAAHENLDLAMLGEVPLIDTCGSLSL